MARKESKNINLQAAKKAANDEFYTQMKDIEEELLHYRNHFVDKVVFCNCDDPKLSNFWRYFHRNFTDLKLKKLISTHYNKISEVSYKMEYMGGDDLNILDGNIVVLNQKFSLSMIQKYWFPVAGLIAIVSFPLLVLS